MDDGIIDFPLPPRGPTDTRRDRVFLALIAKIGIRYGYTLVDNPDRRRAMSLQLMHDLGFRHAAAEFAKKIAGRDRMRQYQEGSWMRGGGRKTSIRNGHA